LSGSVPSAISWALVRPSPSGSAFGLAPGTVRVLKAPELSTNPSLTVGSEEPAPFVPISVNLPVAVLAMFTVRVAEAPPEAIVEAEMLMLVDGENAKVDPMRFAPEMVRVAVVFARADFGLIAVMTGIAAAVTVKPLVSVSISLPVVRVIVLVPVAAAALMFTTAVAVVGEFTVSDATVIPAPKLAVVVPCTQLVN
jgi:hypothetical protein